MPTRNNFEVIKLIDAKNATFRMVGSSRSKITLPPASTLIFCRKYTICNINIGVYFLSRGCHLIDVYLSETVSWNDYFLLDDKVLHRRFESTRNKKLITFHGNSFVYTNDGHLSSVLMVLIQNKLFYTGYFAQEAAQIIHF